MMDVVGYHLEYLKDTSVSEVGTSSEVSFCIYYFYFTLPFSAELPQIARPCAKVAQRLTVIPLETDAKPLQLCHVSAFKSTT